MTLSGSQYWWEVIWLFVIGGILSVFVPKQQEIMLGKKEVRWRIIPALVLVFPYIIWTGYRSNSFGDTATYQNMFSNVPANFEGLIVSLIEDTKDRGYTVLTSLFKMVFGSDVVLFFLFIAVFQMLCIALIYRKYSSNYWISVFLFVLSTDYMSWMHNGMRQFIAVAGLFACFGLIVRKKYFLTFIIILGLSTIHASALFMIPIIFVIQGRAWNKKTVFFILCVGLAIMFVDQFTTILDDLLAETQYSGIITNEVWTSDDGTNIFRVLVYSMPAILSLIGRKYVDEANDPVINISVNASLCTVVIYLLASVSSGIYIGRLPIYTTLYGYIVLPWLIEHIFTENSARLVKILMIIGYIVFFYYQMHMVWGTL